MYINSTQRKKELPFEMEDGPGGKKAICTRAVARAEFPRTVREVIELAAFLRVSESDERVLDVSGHRAVRRVLRVGGSAKLGAALGAVLESAPAARALEGGLGLDPDEVRAHRGADLDDVLPLGRVGDGEDKYEGYECLHLSSGPELLMSPCIL